MSAQTFDGLTSRARERPGSDIQKSGYLKKLKTMKKKFFVLRSTSSSGPARLEYYDSEKKFKSQHLPKRVLNLHQCYNINIKSDTRHKNAIALYTKDECFSVIAEDGIELETWLSLLLEYQNDYLKDYEAPPQHYDHIWQVTIKPKGIGQKKGLIGHYRLCLSDKSIVLIRLNGDKPEFDFQLPSVRRCGHSENFFFMEVGRSAVTGEGELWMQVEDTNIAQNMHEEVLRSMKNSSSATFDQGSFRKRSSTSTSAIIPRNRASLITSSYNESTEKSELVPPGYRDRASSDSHQGSPRRHRAQQPEKRPHSTMYTRTASMPVEAPNPPPGTSPISPYDSSVFPMFDRTRSDSLGSRSSHSTVDHLEGSPTDRHPYLPHRSMTPESMPQSIMEETSYLTMSPGRRSTTPSPPREIPERPGSSGSGESHESGQRSEGYMDMKPGSSVGSTGNDSGYIDMAVGAKDKGHIDISSYMCMDKTRPPPSSPIPIRSTKETTYIDMAPSSQPLPTVKEGGSGEAYLPMTPTDQSPKSSDNLRPTKVISYLSDDSNSGEFPKRAYSVGSRPVSRPIHRTHPHVQDHPAPPPSEVLDNGRSSSAPHLIVQKHRSPYMTMEIDSSRSVSPQSCSIRSDDSFMEMDFYRPRTASDSYGCRPRSSSFGKIFGQGHRPRSSSYGHASRVNKLGSLSSLRSNESIRTTSNEFLRKQSPLASKSSSIDSLKRMSEDLQTRTSQLQSDYMDMNVNTSKPKGSSAGSQKVTSPTNPDKSGYVDMKLDISNVGYLDMTVGSQSKSGKSVSSRGSSQSLGSSPANVSISSHSSREKLHHETKVIHPSGNVMEKGVGFQQGYANILYANVDSGLEGLFLSRTGPGSLGSRSPTGSGKGSEDESYVPFEPEQKKGMSELGPVLLQEQEKANARKTHHHERSSSDIAKSGKHSPNRDSSSKKHSPKSKKGKKSKKEKSLSNQSLDIHVKHEPIPFHIKDPFKEKSKIDESDNAYMELASPVLGEVKHSGGSGSGSDMPFHLKDPFHVEPVKKKETPESVYVELNAPESSQIKIHPIKMEKTCEVKDESAYMDFEPALPDSNDKSKSVDAVKAYPSVPPDSSIEASKPPVPEQYMDYDPTMSPAETSQSNVKRPVPVLSFVVSKPTPIESKGSSVLTEVSSGTIKGCHIETPLSEDRKKNNSLTNFSSDTSFQSDESTFCARGIPSDFESRVKKEAESAVIVTVAPPTYKDSDDDDDGYVDLQFPERGQRSSDSKTGQKNRIQHSEHMLESKPGLDQNRVIIQASKNGNPQTTLSKTIPEKQEDKYNESVSVSGDLALGNLEKRDDIAGPVLYEEKNRNKPDKASPKSLTSTTRDPFSRKISVPSRPLDSTSSPPRTKRNSASSLPSSVARPPQESETSSCKQNHPGEILMRTSSTPAGSSGKKNGDSRKRMSSGPASLPYTATDRPSTRRISEPVQKESKTTVTREDLGTMRMAVASGSMGTITPVSSMPCMTLPDELKDATRIESRHSWTDLTGTSEEQSGPSKDQEEPLHRASSQQQLKENCENPLNYISLDLSENGDKSPARSRHSSALDDPSAEQPGVTYVDIDFKKSESLKNSGNTDVKFML